MKIKFKMAINALIIEDNPMAAEALSGFLNGHEAINIVGVATNLADANEMICLHRPTLLFIDVELPDGDGIEFWSDIKSLYSWFMYAVFYTSYNHYAIKALRSMANDYLVKPVVKEDVDTAMQRFFTACAVNFVDNDRNGKNSRADRSSTMMLFDHIGNRIVMRHQEICFFRYVSDRKIWEAACVNGDCLKLRHGINAQRLLDISPNFVQVHKSYIVNVTYISRIENTQILFIPPCEKINEVQVSRGYRNELFERFCQM